MNLDHLHPVPDIVAVGAAREASDRASALEVLADKRSLRERLCYALLFIAVTESLIVLSRQGMPTEDLYLIMASGYAALIAVGLGVEV